MGLSISRRSLLLGAGAAALAPRRLGALAPAVTPEGEAHELTLVAAERPYAAAGGSGPAKVLSFADRRADGSLFPVVRLPRGARLRATLENRLSEHTSIHWHGVRVPNDQDGVPYLTQPPVQPGERFVYDFNLPDTGSFFFHPHCDTETQLGRGLAGVLIVEGDAAEPFDADEVVALFDWRVGDDGSPGPFSTPKAAARAGTFGNLRGVNGGIGPRRVEAPAGGDLRLRVFNVDATRIAEVGIEGTEAAVIAIDGSPVAPFPLKTWRLGPAMRIDLAVRMPGKGEARLVDYFAAEPYTLATVAARGPSIRRRSFAPKPLLSQNLPEPQVAGAERLAFSFSSSSGRGAAAVAAGNDALGAALLDSLCTNDATYWAINKASWADRSHRSIPEPLAVLERGRTYVAELVNETPQVHPIHLHGFTFKVLESTKRELPVHRADTVLLTPRERITIAFVADNPGDWMLHCHVIEHQETGMMGYLRVRA